MNLLTNDDVKRLRSGEVFKDECDSLSLKASLGVINFCANMLNVRRDATDSALKFIMSNVEKQKVQAAISRECNFTTKEPSCSNYSDEKMIDELPKPKKAGGIVNKIVSSTEVDEPFYLDDFSIIDNNDDFKTDIDLLDLIGADIFLRDREDDAVKKDIDN